MIRSMLIMGLSLVWGFLLPELTSLGMWLQQVLSHAIVVALTVLFMTYIPDEED